MSFKGASGALLAALSVWAAAAQAADKRPVTVPDMIEMVEIAGNSTYREGPVYPAVFSAAGDRFVVVISRGNLADNTREFSILLFDAASPQRAPRCLVTVATRSNEPGIAHVRWAEQDQALLFLAEQSDGVAQVHRLDLQTGLVRPLTTSPGAVLDYQLSPDGTVLLYTARRVPDPAWIQDRLDRGYIVEQTSLDNTLGEGDLWLLREGEARPQEMTVVRLADMEHRRIEGPDLFDCEVPEVAPGNRFAVAYCRLAHTPAHWFEYLGGMQGWAVRPVLGLIDLETGTAGPLYLIPRHQTDFQWSPDGSSLLVRNTVLPFEGADAREREIRRTLRATMMVDPVTRQFTILARSGDVAVEYWSSDGQYVVLRSPARQQDDAALLAFRKHGSEWRPAAVERIPASAGPAKVDRVRVFIDQDMNTPPRLAMRDARGRVRVFYDPNPQFAELQFARVETVQWTTEEGEWIAGVYYPLGYKKGQRYPLVIQTHGFTRDRFQIDGYGHIGYAAQPLAGAGIMVVQMATSPEGGRGPRGYRERVSTSEELPADRRAMEGLIDRLDELGLIDRERVGLQGWSRTTYGVRSMLTHSKYPIKAALISDGVDFGYVTYLISYDMLRRTAEHMNGGIPVGENLRTWQERVPTFNAHRINTPLRIEAVRKGGGGLASQWELYMLLRRLNKPVEMVLYPRGAHDLIKPLERLTSQQGAYDWFRFWLQDFMDSSPDKQPQYQRWEKMRQQREHPR